MKSLRLSLSLLTPLLLLASCKSTGRSKLDSIHFSNGDKTSFVFYDKDMFHIYSCKTTSDLEFALDSTGDLEKAKTLCKDSVTLVTPMAMKDGISQELSGPATDDLIGTKAERIVQIETQIDLLKVMLDDFENELIKSTSEVVQKFIESEIVKFKLSIGAIQKELNDLKLSKNDANELKNIDIKATLALQSSIAETVDARASAFTAILRDSQLFKIDPKRDSIMVKIVGKFPLSCQLNGESGVHKKVRIGVEEIEYECAANAEAKVIATTCAISGYERINNYCLFTGKGLIPKKIVATNSGICAATQGMAVSCWGEAGKFPMVENSFNGGSDTVSRTLPTTKKLASSVVASARQLCSINEEGVVIRCWTNVSNVPGASVKFSNIIGGAGHFCGINSDSTVTCWGESDLKQTDVPSDFSKVRSISTTESNTCGIDINNRLACWGNVRDSTSASPLVTPSDLGEVNSVSVGSGHVCAVIKDNSVRCWGNNDNSKATVPASVKDARLVAAGADETCAVSLSGSMQCWGRRSTSGVYRQGPTLSDVKSIYISRSGLNFCAVFGSTNSVSCWGNLEYSGNFDPAPPSDLKAVKDIAITASGYACAVTETNGVRCWGNTRLVPSTVPDTLIVK